MHKDKIRFLTQRILNILLYFGKKTHLKTPPNISPSSSKSDATLLYLGIDFSFRGLFLALLLPSLDLVLGLGLDLDALGASADIFPPFTRNKCWIFVWKAVQFLFWSIYINNIKYIPRMARYNNDRQGWKNDSKAQFSTTDKDRVYFRFPDPVYIWLYRKKSSRPNKMWT